MRLDVLEHGHGRFARWFQRIVVALMGHEVDDVVKTSMHRPEFFGRHFLAYVREVLRGPSFWTVAEREHLGAVSSELNECPFCVRVHTETARLAGHRDVRPELAAVLTFVTLLNRGEVTPDDVAAVRAAGVPEAALVEALHVNAVFNIVNRLGNAFGWSWDSDEHVRAAARVIQRTRYRLPGLVLR
jgi:AhpD family alkylhydroperoxidase